MTTEGTNMTIDQRLHQADQLLQEALKWIRNDCPQLGSLAMMEALGHVQAIRDQQKQNHHHLAVPHVAISTRDGWDA